MVRISPIMLFMLTMGLPQLSLCDLPCDGDIITNRVNVYRSYHGAPPVIWSHYLKNTAQRWSGIMAENDMFVHSDYSFGENLAMIRALEGMPCEWYVLAAIDMWYAEFDKYNYSRQGFAMGTGHFTQLVWASTRSIGASVSMSSASRQVYVTMEFDPAGNVHGLFDENVLPKWSMLQQHARYQIAQAQEEKPGMGAMRWVPRPPPLPAPPRPRPPRPPPSPRRRPPPPPPPPAYGAYAG